MYLLWLGLLYFNLVGGYFGILFWKEFQNIIHKIPLNDDFIIASGILHYRTSTGIFGGASFGNFLQIDSKCLYALNMGDWLSLIPVNKFDLYFRFLNIKEVKIGRLKMEKAYFPFLLLLGSLLILVTNQSLASPRLMLAATFLPLFCFIWNFKFIHLLSNLLRGLSVDGAIEGRMRLF